MGGSTESALTHPKHEAINCTDVSTLILELPHREAGGKLTPWDEVEEISRVCKERGIHYHCDGARIFEASAGYGHKLEETARPFASVYVSFYKGLGGISGAMLLGDAELCAEARVWLRRLGGNLYSVLPYAVSCWDGFRNNCIGEGRSPGDESGISYSASVFENRRKNLARVVGLLSSDADISSIVQFDPSVPEVNIVHGYLRVSYDKCIAALERVKQSTGVRVLSRVRSCSSRSSVDGKVQEFGCRFEWTMGEANSLIEDAAFLSGWRAFCKELIEQPND